MDRRFADDNSLPSRAEAVLTLPLLRRLLSVLQPPQLLSAFASDLQSDKMLVLGSYSGGCRHQWGVSGA